MDKRLPSRTSVLTARFLLLAALSALLLTLGACTIISERPGPSDWPRLRIIEPKYDSLWQVMRYCYKYTPLWAKLTLGFSTACAEIDLDNMTCTIHVIGPGADRDHELSHCAGADHIGSSQLADLWAGYKARMTKGGAVYYYQRADGQIGRVGP